MDHPGDVWTMVSAVAMAAWGTGGRLYLQRRLLAPVYVGVARAKHQAELARSTPGRMEKKLLLSKATAHTTANDQRLQQAERWHKRVYAPVMWAMTALTLVLSVWGVVR